MENSDNDFAFVSHFEANTPIVLKERIQALPAPCICMLPKVYKAVIPAFVSGRLPTTYGAVIPASVGLLTVVDLIRPAAVLAATYWPPHDANGTRMGGADWVKYIPTSKQM